MLIIFWLIALIIYLAIGYLIAISYCSIIGYQAIWLIATTIVSPIFFVIWAINLIEIFRQKDLSYAEKKEARCALLLWTLFIILPILTHWISIQVELMGLKNIAAMIDGQKYFLQLYVVLLSALFFLFTALSVSGASEPRTKLAEER